MKRTLAAATLLALLAGSAQAQYTIYQTAPGSALLMPHGQPPQAAVSSPFGPNGTMYQPLPSGPPMPSPYAPAPMLQGWQRFGR